MGFVWQPKGTRYWRARCYEGRKADRARQVHDVPNPATGTKTFATKAEAEAELKKAEAEVEKAGHAPMTPSELKAHRQSSIKVATAAATAKRKVRQATYKPLE